MIGSYVLIMEVLIFKIPCCSIPVKYLLSEKLPDNSDVNLAVIN